ncbi:MAG: C_GCAxxG_C_C family protein [Asgard group archaeon]|nr:C_GCAxxG_C_C family protein [Asgard group archaeon]
MILLVFFCKSDNLNDILDFSKKYWLDENCARTTACGILDYYKYTDASEILFKSFAPFGEGLGERLTCGSVIGSLAALSYILSEKVLSKQEILKKADIFKESFREEFGTIQCSAILQPYLKQNESYPSDPVRLDICTKTIKKAVLEVERIIESLS